MNTATAKSRRRNTRQGYAVIVVLALLAIMAMLVIANSRALYHLKKEVDLIEARQMKRLAQPVPAATNTTATLPKPGGVP